MTLLPNDVGVNLRFALRELFAASQDVFISVAFLKSTGLDQVLNDLKQALARGCNLSVIAGLDFYLTDPQALNALFALQKEFPHFQLRLVRADKASTFHPKFYRFRLPDTVTVIVGSANLTGGGLERNIEASVRFSVHSSSETSAAISAFEKSILDHPRCFNPGPDYLLSYETEHSIFHKAQRRAERAAKEAANVVKLDSAKLQSHLKLYQAESQETADFQTRVSNYKTAQKLLTETLGGATNLTQSEFSRAYARLVGGAGAERLWHSGSLHRKKNLVAPNHLLFQEMVREVHGNLGLSPAEMFKLGGKWMRQIPHLGPNVFTEICNTLRPDLYAVLNRNPTTSLRAFGRGAFPDPTRFSPSDYAKFCEIMADLRNACGFSDLGETDHFLNYIYWRTGGRKPRRRTDLSLSEA